MHLYLQSLQCCKPGHPVSVSCLDLQLWDRSVFNHKLAAISPLIHTDLLIFPFFKCNPPLGSKILTAAWMVGEITKCPLYMLLPYEVVPHP